jgi:crotonobetainyl-CoA:carnitine CoA-transferase CaiB-like acyl-CoA transferase
MASRSYRYSFCVIYFAFGRGQQCRCRSKQSFQSSGRVSVKGACPRRTQAASSPPALPVPGIGDQATAISLYAGIVSGLYRRERTGKGCNVRASLVANGVWATAMWLQAALQGAKFSGKIARRHPPNALFANYRTQDNRWVLRA